MILKDVPIQRKLMTVILLISGVVLLLTCSAFFAYEYFTFRQSTLSQISTLGQIISTNSTAALAFDDKNSGEEILSALAAEPHIIAAGLYDKNGHLFAYFPGSLTSKSFPNEPGGAGYFFSDAHLYGFQPIVQGDKYMGTLYMKSDMGAIYERLSLYSIISGIVVFVCFLLAILLSKSLQQGISMPILALAETAKAISSLNDYSVRAKKLGQDELGLLTDAFNQMLDQIEKQNVEILSFNQKLEEKVEERTNELAVANKEMEAFSYSISHDLRAPLRSIDGFARILFEDYCDQVDDEGKKSLERIMGNAQKMGRLIDDLLDFSKVGRKEIQKKKVDMTYMVNSVYAELTGQIEGRDIEFKVQPLSHAVVDLNLMKQVWVNLISNAIKYTRNKEKATIVIDSSSYEDGILYSIKDNGAGFEMQYVDKLFGVFQRLHKERDFEGTGVGLAIVQRIILRHGGRIWADAQVGEGASFYFLLPKS